MGQRPGLPQRGRLVPRTALQGAQDQLPVPAEVLEFIAARIERNIRELEGALIRPQTRCGR
ncbi:DnaA ATPase domain-containing protein [Longimycelium tulufanense]|uniref:DnaA ATPase domain-containing protein n=1 Tax=Longimycelium tulufanense TaxID=907463 RepID=UPI001E57A038|nr:DnaA/Hda family protein [Longimycelium tulufanense]